MSGQDNPSRLPKVSPSSVKQGPLKATRPMSSFVKEGSSLIPDRSLTVSPTWKWGSSHNSGQRSPGSSINKSNPNPTPSSGIRRTASLDAIYLKGHWPRDAWLQVDRFTQTGDASPEGPSQSVCYMSDVEDKIDRFTVRDRTRGTKDSNNRRASSGDSDGSQTNSSFKRLQKSSLRNSEEGLNQEIEQIVSRTNMERFGMCGERFSLPETPDGHRAPLAELLGGTRSRSVNTQTPQDFGSSHSSSGGSQGSSPEQGKLSTSPHINKFARAPPDGCERVFTKTLDNKKSITVGQIPQPPPFKLKPSQGSAFKALEPTTNESDDQPPVPTQQEN